MEFLPLVVDGIIILIFVACIFDGYRKGLIKMLLSIVAFSLSVLIANLLSAPLAQWASDEFAEERVSAYVDGYIYGVLEENGISYDDLANDYFDGAQEKISEAMPEELEAVLESYDISVDEIFEDISSEDTMKTVSRKVSEKIVETVVIPVLEIISFLIVFIICSLVFSIIVNVISSLFKMPIIKEVNKSLGAALGTIKGLVVIGVVCVFAVLAASFFRGNEFADAVSDAALTNTINEVALEFI